MEINDFTLWLFNIAMENGPFIDGLPIDSMVIFHGYASHNQMVTWILRDVVPEGGSRLPPSRAI